MHCVCKLGLGLAEVELQCLPVSQDYKSTNCQPLLTVQRDLQQHGGYTACTGLSDLHIRQVHAVKQSNGQSVTVRHPLASQLQALQLWQQLMLPEPLCLYSWRCLHYLLQCVLQQHVSSAAQSP